MPIYYLSLCCLFQRAFHPGRPELLSIARVASCFVSSCYTACSVDEYVVGYATATVVPLASSSGAT